MLGLGLFDSSLALRNEYWGLVFEDGLRDEREDVSRRSSLNLRGDE